MKEPGGCGGLVFIESLQLPRRLHLLRGGSNGKANEVLIGGRARAVRMVLEQQGEHGAQWGPRGASGHVLPAEYEQAYHRLTEAQDMAA